MENNLNAITLRHSITVTSWKQTIQIFSEVEAITEELAGNEVVMAVDRMERVLRLYVNGEKVKGYGLPKWMGRRDTEAYFFVHLFGDSRLVVL